MNEKIIQIIPCNAKLYAVFNEKDTNIKFKEKVLAFGLTGEGAIYPLIFDSEIGVDNHSNCTNLVRYELKE